VRFEDRIHVDVTDTSFRATAAGDMTESNTSLASIDHGEPRERRGAIAPRCFFSRQSP
jgi:hypothetical protein